MIYRFKIWFKDNDDVVRWIDVKPEQTFLDLHNSFIKSIKFRASEPSSFYMADDKWDKGFEIAMVDMGLDENDSPAVLMKDSPIQNFINHPKQRFVYVTDFMEMWTFHMEFFATLEKDETILYPYLYKSIGKAPAQGDGVTGLLFADDLEMDNIAADLEYRLSGDRETDNYSGGDFTDDDDDDDFDPMAGLKDLL